MSVDFRDPRCSTDGVEQLTVLGLIMALISGLVGIALLVRLLHLYPLRFLRVLLHCLLWFNLLIAFGIAFRHLQLAELFPPGWESGLRLILLDLMAVPKLLFLGAFLEAGSLVTGPNLHDRFKKGYRVVAGSWLALLLLLTAVAPPLGSPGIAFLGHSLFELFILVGLVVTGVYNLLRSFRLSRQKPRTASQIFFGMHSLVFSIMLTSVLSGWALGTSEQWRVQFLNTLLIFLYNALLPAWSFRYVPTLEPVLETERRIQIDQDALRQRYGITHREREVIELICQGKSNQEIADSLFISLQTVKDHIYSIFQKTGVKNRVHLVNLWRT